VKSAEFNWFVQAFPGLVQPSLCPQHALLAATRPPCPLGESLFIRTTASVAPIVPIAASWPRHPTPNVDSNLLLFSPIALFIVWLISAKAALLQL